MATDAFNHAPGQILMSTGSQQFGKPSLGAWTLYGLGSESQNLPGLRRVQHRHEGPQRRQLELGQRLSADRLPRRARSAPAATRCCIFRTRAASTTQLQRESLDAINALNRQHLDRSRRSRNRHADQLVRDGVPHAGQRAGGDGHLADEPEHILKMYGAEPGKPSFAATCLLARRLVERGVRFVEIFHEAWDQHGNLVADLKKNCADTDQASAALVTDLKQRGLLDDTLVIWGGEFGRTPMVQGGGNDGRDHHPNAFTMWLAGGGIKPGITLGESDELGFNVTQGPRPRPRPARHDPAPVGLRPRAVHVQVPRPRPEADRRRAGAGRT